MRALVQRVSYAKITINHTQHREIGPGLLIFLGIREGDDLALCPKLANKCAGLRIFNDEAGKLNLSAVDLGYSALVVSNFTLYGDSTKGMRPSFIRAAAAPLGEQAYEAFVACLRECGLAQVQTGSFGADMQIELVNDGPVTLMLDTDEWKKTGNGGHKG